MAEYFFFLDETGDHGLSFVDPKFPLFLLCGCLFEKSELINIESKINSLKNEIFGSTDVVLHSREIRKCEGAFKLFFDLDLKKKFYEKFDQIIEDSKFIIIGSGVNKELHIKKYGKGAKDPYNLSLSFVIERLIFCLDSNINNNRNSVVNILIEKRGKNEDRQLTDQYNIVYDRGTYYVRSERIKSVIQTFEFHEKMENIIGLQISDLCAYPLARHILYPKEPYISFDLIGKKLYCNKKGLINGYGLKIFP